MLYSKFELNVLFNFFGFDFGLIIFFICFVSLLFDFALFLLLFFNFNDVVLFVVIVLLICFLPKL